MMKRLLFLSFLSFFAFSLPAQLSNDVWNALEKQDRKQARTLLEAALQKEATRTDAAMTLVLLNLLEEREGNLNLMKTTLPAIQDPSPYLYALWFTDAVIKDYQKQDKERMELLEKLFNDSRVNESIKASLVYVLGMHRLFSNNQEGAWKIWKDIQALENWQFVGPFDNTSGSGFNKGYAPIAQPEPQAMFKSATNSNIHWFTPAAPKNDPWIATRYYVPVSQGIVFAQTFVTSPDDREVIVTLGNEGDCRLWVNDQLVLEQEEELKTDMDLYKRQVRLKKGVNRILMQLGFTSKTDYPSFIIRLLDENMKPVQGLTYANTYAPYAKGAESDLGLSTTHFATTFFEKKIADQPDNLLNYLMLARVHYRSNRNNKAIEILRQAEKRMPNNILVQEALIENYSVMGNRTEILKQIEHIRMLDASLPMIVMYDLEQHFKNENYNEAAKSLEELKLLVGEEHQDYIDYRIRLYGVKNEYEPLVKAIEKAYQDYPENPTYSIYKYRIAKNTSQSATYPSYFLQKYLQKTFNANLTWMLIDEYQQTGNKTSAENLMKQRLEHMPGVLEYMNSLANFYFQQENYKAALKYADMKLANAPFDAGGWLDRGYIMERMNRKTEAIADFEKAIHYGPNLFDAREKLRELQGKQPLLSYFKKDDAYSVIQKQLQSAPASDDNYEYIFHERNFVAFAEGASVEYNLIAMRILNKSGIDDWKETSIGYNDARQNLLIEKAETIKKNGQKIAAEQNGNQMVFPSLEVGDAIFIQYKLENYATGKLSKEFWDTRIFNDYVPVKEAIYRVLTPVGFDYKIDGHNIAATPEESNVGDFVMRTWKFENLAKTKEEVYMPSLAEAGMSLQLTSVDSWRTIADWYQDLALPLGREDFNVNYAYDAIFNGKTFASDFEKAQAIYDYLCQNIRYSSVSFRQSNFVPQKPMTTLSTQLGDCKDMSLLYHTLAKKAGIQTHLVLVNTRDNGEENMRTPSLDFNHCIVKIDLKDRAMFQELTSEKLPFGAVPHVIAHAQALVIPNSKDDVQEGSALIQIPFQPVYSTNLVRKTTVNVEGKDLRVNTALKATGNSASDYRYHFSGLTKERTTEEMESVLSQPFKNHLQLGNYTLGELEGRNPEFAYSADFQVENEIMSIGGMKAARLPFFETIFSLNNFPGEERVNPFRYWIYETVDAYDTEIIYQLPEGSEVVELPENLTLDNAYIQYALQSEKLGKNTVKVTRKVTTKKNTIPAAEYKQFRETIKKIVEAEDKYVVFR